MKRHPVDPASLGFGTVFALFGAMFLDPDAGPTTIGRLWPVVAVAMGVLLMALGARLALSGRRSSEGGPEPAHEDSDQI